jgi:hypothetical protein
MKRAILFAAMGIGLAMVASTAHAQAITGVPYLNNIDINAAGYSGDWNNVVTTNVLDVTTGSDQGLEFQVNNGSNGSGENPNSFSTFYSYIPTPATPNIPVTGAVITLTWNSGNAVAGINVVYALDDSVGGTDYYFPTAGYDLTPQPGQTYSYYVPLAAPNLADLNTPGNVVNGFNLQLDPANVYGPYDITFNSIVLVPEPASIGGIGMATCLLAARRRRRTA